MPHTLGIGTHIWPDDPFWVQVREAIEQRTQQHSVALVPIIAETLDRRSDEEQMRFAEEELAQDLDAPVSWDMSERCRRRILPHAATDRTAQKCNDG